LTTSALDVVVIGAGPGGYVAAVHGAQLGLKVGLVERDRRLGGTCLLRGCIPTKALLESASLFDRIRHASKFGIKVGAPAVDFPAVQKYKDRVVDSNARGVEYLTNKYGVQVFKGHARLSAPGQIALTAADGQVSTIQTRKVVLATGSRCSDLPFIKMDHTRILNSDDILEIQTVPPRLLVMGAGAVGSEFASIFARLGSKVDLIELQDRVLPMEDDEICAAVAKSFSRQGITIHTSTKVRGALRPRAGDRRADQDPRTGADAPRTTKSCLPREVCLKSWSSFFVYVVASPPRPDRGCARDAVSWLCRERAAPGPRVIGFLPPCPTSPTSKPSNKPSTKR
jgi:dihydrolipoamide dehydrogenase